jgi:hypothetical protein
MFHRRNQPPVQQIREEILLLLQSSGFSDYPRSEKLKKGGAPLRSAKNQDLQTALS